MKLSPARLACFVVLLPVAGAAACVSRTDVSIGSDCEQGFCVEPPPSFTPETDGGDAETSAEPPDRVLACIGTDCPFPYATCAKTPSFQCGTDLMNDPANCGQCGVTCKGFDGINLDARCVQGACVFECQLKTPPGPGGQTYEFADCNQLLDDGCEVNLTTDAANCGACGNACPSGVRCIKGKCGCPSGLFDCDGQCVDRRSNDNHCGACRRGCNPFPPGGCNPQPPHTRHGCAQNDCGNLKCLQGWGDCNGDLSEQCASDGCEVDLSTDPKNCGGCGVACAPGQECRDEGMGAGPQCRDTCASSGLTQCGRRCTDLLSDSMNCGACGGICPPPRPNQTASCDKGLCATQCLPGFADCNGDPADGCEVDLRSHPANCGACGHACDFGAGQPCIEGKCLMVECDAGVLAK